MNPAKDTTPTKKETESNSTTEMVLLSLNYYHNFVKILTKYMYLFFFLVSSSLQHEPTWACTRCTPLNPVNAIVCEACAEPQMFFDPHSWACLACSFVNTDRFEACQICEQPNSRVFEEWGGRRHSFLYKKEDKASTNTALGQQATHAAVGLSAKANQQHTKPKTNGIKKKKKAMEMGKDRVTEKPATKPTTNFNIHPEHKPAATQDLGGEAKEGAKEMKLDEVLPKKRKQGEEAGQSDSFAEQEGSSEEIPLRARKRKRASPRDPVPSTPQQQSITPMALAAIDIVLSDPNCHEELRRRAALQGKTIAELFSTSVLSTVDIKKDVSGGEEVKGTEEISKNAERGVEEERKETKDQASGSPEKMNHLSEEDDWGSLVKDLFSRDKS